MDAICTQAKPSLKGNILILILIKIMVTATMIIIIKMIIILTTKLSLMTTIINTQ